MKHQNKPHNSANKIVKSKNETFLYYIYTRCYVIKRIGYIFIVQTLAIFIFLQYFVLMFKTTGFCIFNTEIQMSLIYLINTFL